MEFNYRLVYFSSLSSTIFERITYISLKLVSVNEPDDDDDGDDEEWEFAHKT